MSEYERPGQRSQNDLTYCTQKSSGIDSDDRINQLLNQIRLTLIMSSTGHT